MKVFCNTYDKLLTEWISLCLNKKGLGKVMRAIDADHPVEATKIYRSNKNYLEKILREEASKQFSSTNRPVLEVTLNSIDAKPENAEEYNIYIDVKPRQITVTDAGTSMGLQEILSDLIIPFSTQKDGIKSIGKFGIGFFATFNYCVKSLSNDIKVIASDGINKYELKFYSTSDDLADLRLRLSKLITHHGNLIPGTKIVIRRGTDCEDMIEYLKSGLSKIHEKTAKIFINDELINIDEGIKISKPVNLSIKDQQLNQEVYLSINEGFSVELLSQGVGGGPKTDTHNLIGALVYFPSGAQLVEGRDEFKKDDNYQKCVDATFTALQEYTESHRTKPELMANLVASLASVLEVSHDEIKNINKLKEIIFGQKQYLIGSNEYFKKFVNFFGPDIKKVIEKVDEIGLRFWKHFDDFKDGDIFMNKFFEKRAEDYNKRKIVFDYPNLFPVLEYALGNKYTVKLVHSDTYGKTPFFFLSEQNALFYDRPIVFVNLSNPEVSGEYDVKKAYKFYWDLIKQETKAVGKMEFVDFRETRKLIERVKIDVCDAYGTLDRVRREYQRIDRMEAAGTPAEVLGYFLNTLKGDAQW